MLAQMEAQAADVLPAFVTALGDKGSSVRASAADGIAKIGQSAAAAVPALMTALKDSTDPVRFKYAGARRDRFWRQSGRPRAYRFTPRGRGRG